MAEAGALDFNRLTRGAERRTIRNLAATGWATHRPAAKRHKNTVSVFDKESVKMKLKTLLMGAIASAALAPAAFAERGADGQVNIIYW